MTEAAKISSCVDCAAPIIGERLRCPACHEQHSVELLAGDEDATLPRDRLRPPSIWEVLLAWLVVVQLAAIVVSFLILAGKGCQ